jgi:FAD/FMN-containing dehydrogenase
VLRTRDDPDPDRQAVPPVPLPADHAGRGHVAGGSTIGAGIQVDTSKHYNRLLEVNVDERWACVEPGIVLDELNATLWATRTALRTGYFDASRATVGGMMANNSSGARSVLYGKTIDHVLEQHVVLSDGSLAHLRPLQSSELEAACAGSSLEAACYREVRRLAVAHADEIARRYPKILRRVGGYNLDAFVAAVRPPQGTQPAPFDLTRLMVGSEGTLGVVLEAKIRWSHASAGRCSSSSSRSARGPGRDTRHPHAWLSAVEVMDGHP